MNEVKDYVDFRLTHSDKFARAEGYPLELSNCKKYKPMRDLKIYGNSFQNGTPSPETPVEVQSVGDLVTDTADANYGKYKIPVVQRGINLFDKDNITVIRNSGITEIKSTDTGISFFTPYTSGFCMLDMGLASNYGGKTLTLTTKDKWSPLTKLLILTADNSTIEKSSGAIQQNGDLYYTTVSIENNTYADEHLCLRLYFNDYEADRYFEYRDIMVTESDTPKAYEPYIEPVTTNIFLDEPLRKLGDYADYIDFKENKVVRNIKEVVLKGGEINYIAHNTTGNYLMWYTPANYKDVNPIYFNGYIIPKELCTHIIAHSYMFSLKPAIPSWYINLSGSFIFNAELDMFASDGVKTTITDANNWLASQYENGTPVKFNYILATPKEEAIPLEIPKLTAKTTIIEVDTSLLPSGTYGKYIKR